MEEVDLYLIHGHYWEEERERWVAWFELNLDVAPSRGRVRLTAPDPEAPLDIDHAYLSDSRELEACCDGVELIKRLVTTRPLADALDPITGLVPEWDNREALRAWVREHIATSFHPSSTCRMGPDADPEAVVDHTGCVYGVAGLRIADASIFPTSLRANPHCTVVAMAEKLADAIRHEDRV